MKSVAISEFKARCLALLKEVQQKGEPLLVTKRGRAMVRVLPAREVRSPTWLGAMAGTATIAGDLIRPASDPDEWEANRR